MARPGRRRLASLRVRTTLAATLVVGVASLITGLILLQLLRGTMTHNIDAVANARASDVAALVRSGNLPDPIPTPFEEGSLVQVLDSAGHVVASSSNVQGESPIVNPVSVPAGTGARTIQQLPIGEGGSFRMVTERATSNRGTDTILVAISLGPVDSALRDVTWSLLAALPILLGVVAVTTWIMTGRTLRPVESIRAQVAEISTQEMDRRVPVPDASDEIQRLATTMNSMLDRLEAAQARETRFVADASHELRSPLAAVRAQLETALAHAKDADWPAIATTVLNEELSMERLITDLLLLARADHGNLANTRTSLDLRQVVLDELNHVPLRQGLTLDVSAMSDAQVIGDPEQLARVIRNLFENAQRYASSTVTVELATKEKDAEIVIADDGPGIPPSEKEQVFDRFMRLDEARSRRSGGIGLGLSIAREIVEAHGGTIAVTEAAKGARVAVRLPLATAN